MHGRGDPLDRLRAGGKAALARALAHIEAAPEDAETLGLLDAAWEAGGAPVLGLTGPPGVGKSTLLSRLVRAWRERGLTVGVVAVDPSSRRSGGALLGDRTRFEVDPEDPGVFVRSLAARTRLGGLADLAAPAVALMRALFDRVVVETVGVGQSETEVREVADVVLLALQPASGDLLQFMKAGVLEIPDVLVVTKADLGEVAERTRREAEIAVRRRAVRVRLPVRSVSAATGGGIGELVEGLEELFGRMSQGGELARLRARQADLWLRAMVREEFGRFGLRRLEASAARLPSGSPFARFAAFARGLARELSPHASREAGGTGTG